MPIHDDPEFQKMVVSEFFMQSVADFDCHSGLLASLFDPALYVGICGTQFEMSYARKATTGYDFCLYGDPEIAECDNLLAHDALCRIRDDEIWSAISTFVQPRVFISELLGRELRKSEPGVFYRDMGEYMDLMARAGYRMHRVRFNPVKGHSEHDWQFIEFHKKQE